MRQFYYFFISFLLHRKLNTYPILICATFEKKPKDADFFDSFLYNRPIIKTL